MPTITFPSEFFPAPPAVGLELPEGWEPIQAPGTVLAARVTTPGASGFLSNVVVRAQQREQGFEVGRAVSEIQAVAPRQPQGVASEPFQVDIDGLTFVGIDQSWIDPDVGTILQVHLFHALASRVPGGSVQLLQLTGSCGGEDAMADYEVLKSVFAAASVTPWTSGQDGS